tara:strand:- start:2788 stop:3102 length:315 start_codon:yes stop_codon:yes gene_type:complete
MAKAALTHEQKLMSESALLLAGHETSRQRLRMLCSLDLSPTAGPEFDLLRGAALAFVRTGENHPQFAQLYLALKQAVALARMAARPIAPVYTGGARPFFEREGR